jgi:transcriptional regulator with XRE-family HTH domain
VPTISDRLREQREALGFTQQALAARCGIAARSQRNYESGERLPDAAYLAAITAAGADVLYILTGQRGAPVAPALKPDEAALLDNYRHSPRSEQDLLRQTSAAFARAAGRKAA